MRQRRNTRWEFAPLRRSEALETRLPEPRGIHFLPACEKAESVSAKRLWLPQMTARQRRATEPAELDAAQEDAAEHVARWPAAPAGTEWPQSLTAQTATSLRAQRSRTKIPSLPGAKAIKS